MQIQKLVTNLLLSLILSCGNYIYAQSFTKGVILVSLTEGNTFAHFTTTNIIGGDGEGTINNGGQRDPLTIEYGITSHLGISICSGGDIYNIHKSALYILSNNDNIKTSDLTFELNYHYFNTKHWDFAGFIGVGGASITVKNANTNVLYDGNSSTNQLISSQYQASGNVLRIGSKVRYYFGKRFGLIWMLTGFNATYNPDNTKNNSLKGSYIATNVKGIASEIGLNVRFF